MVGGQNGKQRWRDGRNERLKDGYEAVLIIRRKMDVEFERDESKGEARSYDVSHFLSVK